MQAAAPKPKAIRRAHPGQGVPVWRSSKWPKQRSCVENGERGLGRDHLYSVAALTNQAKNVVERYRYDTYGQRTVLAADGITTRTASLYGQQIGFTGYYRDVETGLYYARARMYSPTLGRFVNRDRREPWFKKVSMPLPLDGYKDGMNLYMAYFVPGTMDPLGTNISPTPTDGFCKYEQPCERIFCSVQSKEILDDNGDTMGTMYLAIGQCRGKGCKCPYSFDNNSGTPECLRRGSDTRWEPRDGYKPKPKVPPMGPDGKPLKPLGEP